MTLGEAEEALGAVRCLCSLFLSRTWSDHDTAGMGSGFGKSYQHNLEEQGQHDHTSGCILQSNLHSDKNV